MALGVCSAACAIEQSPDRADAEAKADLPLDCTITANSISFGTPSFSFVEDGNSLEVFPTPRIDNSKYLVTQGCLVDSSVTGAPRVLHFNRTDHAGRFAIFVGRVGISRDPEQRGACYDPMVEYTHYVPQASQQTSFSECFEAYLETNYPDTVIPPTPFRLDSVMLLDRRFR